MKRTMRLPLPMQRKRVRVAVFALSGIALTVLVAVVLPARRELDALESAGQRPGARGEDSREAQLAQFYAWFPPLASAPEAVRAIARSAHAGGITLEQGEYRLVSDQGALLRYEITLPVRASYPQVRRFIARVLFQLPNAALDGVTFEKHKAAEAVVDAKVRFTLYVRGQS